MGDVDRAEELDSAHLDKGMRLAFGVVSHNGGESVMAAIQRVTGPTPQVVLTDQGEEEDPVLRIPAKSESDTFEDTARYQVVGEIARGGVGVVYQGKDLDLGRDVAIKVLRSDRVGSSDVVQRFIEEAQIGGQLQHPGVVPVYGLGVQPDGRPYFVMKLVKGETLAAMLKSRRKVSEKRGRLLQIFEQVCQSVAYAHARRVIHRDLKPANVLVGAYGQVQVVDWGFAKVLRRGGIADEAREPQHAPDTSLIETIRSSEEGSKSIAGSVMGTPAYMPPEQAHGHVARVDKTSDVFALGGILAEILTGRPPYAGSTATEVMRQAIDGDTSAACARLKRCGADRELVLLAKHCLIPAQSARPRDANEVAEAIHDYLVSIEDRAHKAEVDAAKARVREEGERRAKRLTLGLAAAVLVGVLGVGAGFWRADRGERERTARAAQTVWAALDDVSLALGRAREAGSTRMEIWPEAVAAAEQAATLAEKVDAPEDLRARAVAVLDTAREEHAEAKAVAEQQANETDMVARLLDVREYRWVPRAVTLDKAELAQEASRFEEAFRAGGIDWDLPRKAAARVRASEHRDQLILSLDAWRWFLAACELDTGAVDRHLQRADPDALRSTIRTAGVAKDADTLRGFLADPGVRQLPPLTLATLCPALLVAEDRAASLDVARAWQALAPDDPDANLALGRTLLWQESVTELRYKEAALYLTRALSQNPRGLAARCFLVGALTGVKRLDEAILTIRDALALAPDERGLRLRLGALLTQRAQGYVKAEMNQAAYDTQKEAIGEWEMADPDGGEVSLSGMYHFLAVYAKTLGRWPEVLRASTRAVELNTEAIPSTRETLAMAQLAHGRIQEAMRTMDGVDKLDHACPRSQMVRACALTCLGRLEEALEKVQGIEELPLEHGDLPDDNLAYYQLMGACILEALGRHEDAIDVLDDCMDLAPDKPQYPAFLERVLRHGGEPRRARQAGERAIELQLSHLRTLPPNTPEYFQAALYWGRLVGNLDDLRAARARFRMSFRDRPLGVQVVQAMYMVGVSMSLWIRQARGDESREAIREALDYCPRCALAWQQLAVLKSSADDQDGAIEAMEKASEYSGSVDAFAVGLANLYLADGRADEIKPLLQGGAWSEFLRETYRPLIALDGKVDQYLRGHWHPPAADRVNLAYLLETRGRHVLVLQLIEEALSDGPPDDMERHLRVGWRTMACYNGALATAALAGDPSLSRKERSRRRREGADWIRKLGACQAKAAGYFNLYTGNPHPGAFASTLLDSRLASIRDEEAMADASEEDKELCRLAWAVYRATYDGVR